MARNRSLAVTAVANILKRISCFWGRFLLHSSLRRSIIDRRSLFAFFVSDLSGTEDQKCWFRNVEPKICFFLRNGMAKNTKPKKEQNTGASLKTPRQLSNFGALFFDPFCNLELSQKPKGSKQCFPNGVFQIPHLGLRQRKTLWEGRRMPENTSVLRHFGAFCRCGSWPPSERTTLKNTV